MKTFKGIATASVAQLVVIPGYGLKLVLQGLASPMLTHHFEPL